MIHLCVSEGGSEWVTDMANQWWSRQISLKMSTLVIRSKCISSALGPSTKYQILTWSAYIFMCNIFLQWTIYLLCSVCPEKVITSKRQRKVPNLWQSQCTAAATLIYKITKNMKTYIYWVNIYVCACICVWYLDIDNMNMNIYKCPPHICYTLWGIG